MGEQLIGAKVSFGEADAEPRVGWLTEGMLLSIPLVSLQGLVRPRAEPKLAFLLRRAVRWSTASASDLLAATARVLPCLEILDTGRDARDGPADQVAHQCTSSKLLIGMGVAPPAEGSLRRLRADLDVHGALPEPERRPAAASSSLEAVTWLGSRLAREGREPERGTLLISTAVAGSVELAPNVRITADFGMLGTLGLRTTSEPRSPAPGAQLRLLPTDLDRFAQAGCIRPPLHSSE